MCDFELLHKPVFKMNDGAQIATYIYGPSAGSDNASIPIVMLHGNGESHENMRRLIEMVAPERLVYAIDSRGHGASTRGTQKLSYELLAHDVLEVLEQLEASKVHVIGFSDGGIVGLLLAMDNPQVISSLTALGANLSPAGLNQSFIDSVTAEVSELEPEGLSTNSQSNDVQYSQVELLRLMLEEPHINPLRLSRIACPVAVMIGSQDLVTYDEAYTIAAAILNSSLTIVKGASHDLPNEAPERVIHEAAVAICEAEQNA